MIVSIGGSASEKIDKSYYEKAKELFDYLAVNNYDLTWGSVPISLMGLAYESFSKNNRVIHGYVMPKYKSDIEVLPKATHKICSDSFDLKKYLYNDADMVICLPGGIGTISEFFAYVEEARNNDNVKPIILYNINNYFDNTMKLIEDLIEKDFNDSSVLSFVKVINGLDEFIEYTKNFV